MNTTILFCLFLGITSTSTWAKVNDVKSQDNHVMLHRSATAEKIKSADCSPLYHPVGDHCFFLERDLFGTWQEMRDVCLDLGGDLPNFSDANVLADINDYLIANDLDDVSYWVGSTDESTEGEWYWISDQSYVKMGTPLWGDFADMVQQPTGGSLENCGVLLQEDHYFMHDANCNESYFLLCEESGQLTEVEDAGKNATSSRIPNTCHSAECPSPYEMFIDKCLFINTLAQDTWDTHTVTCKGLGGHLGKLDDANVLGAISDYLVETGIKEWFWIGGSDQEREGDWKWHDNSHVRLGTPFWGDDEDQYQEPDGHTNQNCAALYPGDNYFFHDMPCVSNFSSICQMDI